MHHFFVKADCIDDFVVTLEGAIVHQIIRVLRLRLGDTIVVLDNSGWENVVSLETFDDEKITGKVLDRFYTTGEPKIDVVLYQSLLKFDRFEFILQKGTELGVSSFVPVICERSVIRNKGDQWFQRRHDRWERIILEAAEQSHRGKLPVIHSPVNFIEATRLANHFTVFPSVKESSINIEIALKTCGRTGLFNSKVGVFVGPEGGFTDAEVAHASSSGIVPVTLGRRVLRAETASIVALTLVLSEFNEL